MIFFLKLGNSRKTKLHDIIIKILKHNSEMVLEMKNLMTKLSYMNFFYTISTYCYFGKEWFLSKFAFFCEDYDNTKNTLFQR